MAAGSVGMSSTGQEIAQPRPLSVLRAEIDRIDNELVRLLNERARVVVEVGARKKAEGGPIYAPIRERAVLQKVLALNSGPLLNASLESIWREIMSASFALERPLRIAYLGPPGSFSHEAASRHFGTSVSFENCRSIAGVFEEVAAARCDYGLVPVENPHIGSVAETLEGCLTHAGAVAICAEVQLSVQQAFITVPGAQPSQICAVASKQEALGQCARWLQMQWPHAQLLPAASTSAAVAELARRYAEEQAAADADGGAVAPASAAGGASSAASTSAPAAAGSGAPAAATPAAPGSAAAGGADVFPAHLKARQLAAIGSRLAAQLHGLQCMFDDVADSRPNVTRFLVITNAKTAAAAPLVGTSVAAPAAPAAASTTAAASGPAGSSAAAGAAAPVLSPVTSTGSAGGIGAVSSEGEGMKTSLLFVCADRPGVLRDVLHAFSSRGINLTHVEKRPAPPLTMARLVAAADAAAPDDSAAESIERSRRGSSSLAAAASSGDAPAAAGTAQSDVSLPPSALLPALLGGRGSAARSTFSYAFFLDAEAGAASPHMRDALAEVRALSQCLLILGSYPAARRVL